LTISSQTEGALELLSVPDFAPLLQIATQDPLVLEIISYAWMAASTIDTEVQTVRESIEKIMPALVTTFKDTDAVTLISFVGNLLPKLEFEVSCFTCSSIGCSSLIKCRLYLEAQPGLRLLFPCYESS
jgi:hypothetical protein